MHVYLCKSDRKTGEEDQQAHSVFTTSNPLPRIGLVGLHHAMSPAGFPPPHLSCRSPIWLSVCNTLYICLSYFSNSSMRSLRSIHHIPLKYRLPRRGSVWLTLRDCSGRGQLLDHTACKRVLLHYQCGQYRRLPGVSDSCNLNQILHRDCAEAGIITSVCA